MPIIPPPSGGVYDTCNTILNACRFRLNDKIQLLAPTSGKILDETQASTQTAFNSGYRRFQEAASDLISERLEDETVIYAIPPTVNQDPASQCYISWFEFFDGTNASATPTLPNNLMLPLWMSERPNGANWPFPHPNNPNMTCFEDGLPMQQYKRNCNGCWEWRGDKIYFPGSLIAMDFRIRYRAYLADIVDVGDKRWWTQDVPMMRCLDPLSWWVCAEFAAARSADGDASEQMLAVAAACEEKAMEATMRYANRDVMKNERNDTRRQPYGGGSRGQGNMGSGWGTGYQG